MVALDNPQMVMVVLAACQMALYSVGWLAVLAILRAERIAVGYWAAGWLVLALGLILIAQRTPDRAWWAFTGCNIVILTGYSLVRQGLERFVGLNRLPETALTLMAAVGVLLWLGSGAEHAPWRVIVVYGGGTWIMLRVIMVARRVSNEFGKAWALLVLTPLVMLGTASGLVVVLQAMDMQRSLELHHFTSSNVRILFIYMFVAGAFNLSFFVLVTLRLVQRLRHQNERDPLTGLFNRRALEGALGREWHRFTRSGQSFSVLMVDIDLFKPVNDTHGHAVGDLVLKEVAERVRNASRTLDMAVRHGGEEFLVLMPLCDLDGAKVVAERVRRAVEENPVQYPGAAEQPQGLQVTVSVGVATADTADGAGAMLVARADRALYAAKRAGRNCVQVSSA